MGKPIDRAAIWGGECGGKNRILDGCVYWRHLANTVEQLCAAAVVESGNDAIRYVLPVM